MRIFLYIGITLFFFGCQIKKNSDTQEVVPTVELDSLSKEKIALDLLNLSPEAEKSLENFDDFQNVRNMMGSMRNANPFYIKKYADSIDVLISLFKENLDKDLNVNTINSRISVLSTETGLLKLLSEKKKLDSKTIIDANTKLIKAYNSLIIQLNELSLAIPDSIEKELLRDKDTEEDQLK